MNDVTKLLQQHRSIRKFKTDAVQPDQVKAIIESAQMASTSSNVQAYSVVGVTDAATKQELSVLTGNQKYVEQCPLFLVWCADLHRIKQACQKHQVEMVAETMENFILATVDTALAAQNAAVAAESMGLGIVYIGGIRNQPREVSKLLKLPSLVYPVFGMCVGYPDQAPTPRPRINMGAIYHDNTYSNESYSEAIEKYDRELKSYYLNRSGGKRDTTWSQDMARKFEKAARIHMRSFLEEQGYRFD